ncbi:MULTISPECIES: efflux RND transporter permease subunit [unclassified Dyella]|uniref:efflux RND transporter permease subunit n=1 Tax=unclassified Dyella TaxID=2634549 RepID=UPI000C83EE42|nr:MULTISPECIES: efflux RND transporter permease subunit [unclassified Dyella]MDR3446960.1 efflux RND transporter permease subunit [Dyella sp.]PMQ05899.1 Multidrug resistance protein MdtC [Dyella sp. AD56]
MLGIVRIALTRPYTFIVLALAILIFGVMSAMRTPTDIFPEINIPVIAVSWQFTGMTPDQMSGRMNTPFERVLTTTVNDIEHIESESINGMGITKIFFQPGVNIATANAQVTAIAQTILKQMPAGATPPLIVNYNASTVPILQLALSGTGLSEQQLGDIGLNQLRPQLVTVPGAAIPYPFGGKTRQVQLDVDPAQLQARGLSTQDVANALANQQQISPIGTQKIGKYEYVMELNNAAIHVQELEDLPVKEVNGTTIYIRDVAHVRDGNPPQTNIVHVDGKRSTLLSILKNGSTSTLAIVAGAREKLAQMKDALPENLTVTPIGDQSVFVRSSIDGVVREGIIAAALTSLMILLFLGSWRSTLIITTSIPLAVLGSVFTLSAIGQTLNIMTLGGLALAVGILVDEATVTIENINWHLEQGKDVITAIVDGSAQIIVPAFVSLCCICIVFVPMFFLPGVARYLFVPMAEAVIFAMIFSFILSRTLVLTMAKYLLHAHPATVDEHGQHIEQPAPKTVLGRFQQGFVNRFEKFRAGYSGVLHLALEHRKVFVVGFLGFVLLSFALLPGLGSNFFPDVDGGQILVHVRVPVGTRVETTSAEFSDIQKAIRQVIPPDELEAVVDNIGQYSSSINTIYNNTGEIGESDGDIQISLKEGHRPSAEYVKILREKLPRSFPGSTFSFPPADIVSQILNFGSPAPIDLQVRGGKLDKDFAYANELLNKLRQIPGVVDARLQQSQAQPAFRIDVDRTRAQLLGLTEADVTNSLIADLSGTAQVAPTYWLNPDNNVTYPISAQVPQYQLDSLPQLNNLPITAKSGGNAQVLGALADITRTHRNTVVSQYNIQSMVEIFAAIQGRDLGAVAGDIQKVIDDTAKDKPKGANTVLLGQVQTMHDAYSGLLFGLLGSIVLVYLLIVVNFQSWTDPFVIITALPAALAGILWMLFVTHTTLSVPALTGAIMCMGVATANSVLVVSFCRERLSLHGDALLAAREAGFVRFRPVLMTALAMIIGMVPMALGLGDGGEQNAPLGRAVIGGLLFATTATLIFVPVVFSIVHARYKHAPDSDSADHAGVPAHV